MSQRRAQDEDRPIPGDRQPPRKASEPGWASGLRKLYKSVLDEPLPDSFDDLLKKLDRGHDR